MMGRVTLISGREGRRHWTFEERTRILSAISAPGAVVAEVARREDICASLVYKWRREARKEGKFPGFAPVVIAAAPPAPPPGNVGERGVITVELNEARVRICAEAPTALISATLKALRS
jgi:transposase